MIGNSLIAPAGLAKAGNQEMRQHRPRVQFDKRSLCVLDIETISGEPMEDGGFPPWCLHTPVVASLLTADLDRHGEWAFDLENVRFTDNHDALDRIDDLLQGRACITFEAAISTSRCSCWRRKRLVCSACRP